MQKITTKIAGTSNIPEIYLNERPPFPKTVKIEITSKCDLKCFFCSLTYKKRKKEDINRDFLFRILDEIKELGVEEVGFFWLGEPLLLKELPEYIRYAKKIGIKYVFITTNGRMAIPERIAPVIDSGLDSIKFSINASNKEQFKKVCGVDAFDDVINNIKSTFKIRGSSKKPGIYASTVFDPNSKDSYKEVESKIIDYVDEHYPLRLYGNFSYKEIDGIDNENGINVEARTLKSMLPCWALFTEPHISYDGFLSACYCDHDSRLHMGDLNKISLKDAWHSQEFVKLRKQHLNKNVKGSVCESCIAYL